MTGVPAHPKLYHIVHLDRLASIVADGCLWSDAERIKRERGGTTIGMDKIKKRRLQELVLGSHPDLHVGDCVPFYFCPRSVMLYVISKANNPDLRYTGGQRQIVHLEADFAKTVDWARAEERRWAFTDMNAGAYFFNDWNDPARLDCLDWQAIGAADWRACKDGKQAEFLVEGRFPWDLVERVGVIDRDAADRALACAASAAHKPAVEIRREWYY